MESWDLKSTSLLELGEIVVFDDEPDVLDRPEAGFSGDLQFCGLAEVLQILGHSRQSGQISIHGGTSGEILIAAGQIADAHCRDRFGDEAVFDLLATDEGSFAFRAGALPSGTAMGSAPARSLASILLDHAWFEDEIAHRPPVDLQQMLEWVEGATFEPAEEVEALPFASFAAAAQAASPFVPQELIDGLPWARQRCVLMLSCLAGAGCLRPAPLLL
jgi:hypothetical protein